MFLRAFIFSFYEKFHFIISKATLLFILYYFIIHLTSQLFEIKKKKKHLNFYFIILHVETIFAQGQEVQL